MGFEALVFIFILLLAPLLTIVLSWQSSKGYRYFTIFYASMTSLVFFSILFASSIFFGYIQSVKYEDNIFVYYLYLFCLFYFFQTVLYYCVFSICAYIKKIILLRNQEYKLTEVSDNLPRSVELKLIDKRLASTVTLYLYFVSVLCVVPLVGLIKVNLFLALLLSCFISALLSLVIITLIKKVRLPFSLGASFIEEVPMDTYYGSLLFYSLIVIFSFSPIIFL